MKRLQLAGWFDDYTSQAAHSALGSRSAEAGVAEAVLEGTAGAWMQSG